MKEKRVYCFASYFLKYELKYFEEYMESSLEAKLKTMISRKKLKFIFIELRSTVSDIVIIILYMFRIYNFFKKYLCSESYNNVARKYCCLQKEFLENS